MPLYKRYKQTAFALHVNGYLQERGVCVCVCVCVCVRSSPRQPELSEENTAVIIKGTKHWRLKTHERKRKHTSQSRRSQTHSLSHAQTLTLMHTGSLLALRFVQQGYITSMQRCFINHKMAFGQHQIHYIFEVHQNRP